MARKQLKTNRSISTDLQINIKRITLKYPLYCSERELDVLLDEYHLNRKFDGASGVLKLTNVKVESPDKKERFSGALILELVLETADLIADYEAPIIANAIIEKFDKKRFLGIPSACKFN